MNPSRRHFLLWAGGLSALSLSGCPTVNLAGLLPPAKPVSPLGAPPKATEIDPVSHVLNRLTFGPIPGAHARVTRMGVDRFIEEQLTPEAIDDAWCDYQTGRFETLRLPVGELFEYKEDFLQKEATEAKLFRAVYSRRQLLEVMVDFWTDHFNIDLTKGDCPWLKVADDRDVVRKHALGSFPAMLRASALSPAMLWYLDGRSNRRDTDQAMPNENYARELLELHTMGVNGGYTQQDVMEAARCLTGWYVRSEELTKKGHVVFRPAWHDDGEKRVLGHTIPEGQGEKDLDRLLDIVALHPATARFIATKLCRYFVSDSPPKQAVETVAGAFLNHRGDMRPTLNALFHTDAFRASAGARFKRPFRYLVSALRATSAETRGGGELPGYLERMGHAPFQYPTPDGYPHEEGPWLGSLLWRWHFAVAFARNAVPGVKVDWDALRTGLGGDNGLMAHLLGRQPDADERTAIAASGLVPAALLASPAFQRY